MNIGTRLTTRVKGGNAEAVAEQYEQLAEDIGAESGVQVSRDSSNQTTVTVDSAALKVGARLEAQDAGTKTMMAATAGKSAALLSGQAHRELRYARDDRNEANSANSRADELSKLSEKKQQEQAKAEQELFAKEKAKKEAENAAFVAREAAEDYKTRGEAMLAEALGDPIKMAQAFEQLASAARQQTIAEASDIKAHTAEDAIAQLRSKSAGISDELGSMSQERGFMLENAQTALKSAAEREASAAETENESVKAHLEAEKLQVEAGEAMARSSAQSALAGATDAKVMSAVAAAF